MAKALHPDGLERGGVPTRQYRAIWISDIHLGTRGSKAEFLLDFLSHTESEYLYLVGDIVDGWRLRKSVYWNQSHNDVIQKLLRKARKGTKVVYIPGNHDEALRDYVDMHFGGVHLVSEATHVTRQGRRLLVIHGDAFDGVNPRDESRALAKVSLLNLYSRLVIEPAPTTGEPWSQRIQELFLATRERIVAQVDQACYDTVRALSARGKSGYHRAPVGDHLDNLREIPGVSCVEPKGAFYAFPDLSAFIGRKTPEGKKIENDVQLCEWLIEAAKVAVVMGSAFGAPGFVRLSYACAMADIVKGVDRIGEALGQLK